MTYQFLDIPPQRLTLGFGIMRLDAMISFNLIDLIYLIEELEREAGIPKYENNVLISDDQKARLNLVVEWTRKTAAHFEWQSVHDHTLLLEAKIIAINTSELMGSIRDLKYMIRIAMTRETVFRYKNDESKLLHGIDVDWKASIQAFGEASADISNGVKCLCVDQPTACAYHMMRVLEHGLRSLSELLGIEFTVQNWHNIIDQIESEARKRTIAMPSGKDKSRLLTIISTCAKEFSYFKDGWRNHVAHCRVDYDKLQAESIMIHVRQFMNGLSRDLKEVSDLLGVKPPA